MGELTVVHVPPGTICNEAVAILDKATAAVTAREENFILNDGYVVYLGVDSDRNDILKKKDYPRFK